MKMAKNVSLIAIILITFGLGVWIYSSLYENSTTKKYSNYNDPTEKL